MEGRSMYSKSYEIRWADLDPNGHLHLTAYAAYALDARVGWLRDNGFSPTRFAQERFGPVVFSETNRYLKEVRLGEAITVTVQLAGLSPDAARWRIQHDVYRPDGEKAAMLVVEGSWLSMETRKLTLPPPDLQELMPRSPTPRTMPNWRHPLSNNRLMPW